MLLLESKTQQMLQMVLGGGLFKCYFTAKHSKDTEISLIGLTYITEPGQ